MGKFITFLSWTLVLPAAVLGLSLGSAIQGQTLSPSDPVPAVELPPKDASRSTPAPAPAADLTIKRYKVRLSRLDRDMAAFESWIVFDLIGGNTVVLLRHAATNGIKWWDHPVLSSKACRIIRADGGERLIDCLRATRSGPGELLRITLPQGSSLTDYFFTFMWQESGRTQDGMTRIDQTMKPELIGPVRLQPIAPDSRSWRYKVKLSQGSFWTNLGPESWIVFDVIRGTTVTLKHTTNSVDFLTGFSHWWDHPVLSVVACPLFPTTGNDQLPDCLRGVGAGSGEPLRIKLPEGASLHDYNFTFTWQESGRIQEGETIVDREVKPTLIPLP
jgi:hypothetical protein